MFYDFYQSKGIFHEFSAPLTPRHNGVVERKNKTLQEMTRAMVHAKSLPLHFQVEAVNTTCLIHNRISLRPGTEFTNYQLWKDRKLNFKYFHIFGSKCHILKDREYHQKWDFKSDEGIFLGYSINSRAIEFTSNALELLLNPLMLL